MDQGLNCRPLYLVHQQCCLPKSDSTTFLSTEVIFKSQARFCSADRLKYSPPLLRSQPNLTEENNKPSGESKMWNSVFDLLLLYQLHQCPQCHWWYQAAKKQIHGPEKCTWFSYSCMKVVKFFPYGTTSALKPILVFCSTPTQEQYPVNNS